jgi:RTX calcium-binding nonapeptide repeat (4 copies)
MQQLESRRLFSAFTVDTSFGDNGGLLFTEPTAESLNFHAIDLGNTGRVAVMMRENESTGTYIHVVDSAGRLVNRTPTQIRNRIVVGNPVADSNTGRFAYIDRNLSSSNNGVYSFSIRMFDSSGREDTRFSRAPFLVYQDVNSLPGNPWEEVSFAMAFDSQGGLLVQVNHLDFVKIQGFPAGSNGSASTYVARFKTDGTLDRTFGSNGVAIHTVTSGVLADSAAVQMLVTPDGRIVCMMTDYNGSSDLRLTSFDATGKRVLASRVVGLDHSIGVARAFVGADNSVGVFVRSSSSGFIFSSVRVNRDLRKVTGSEIVNDPDTFGAPRWSDEGNYSAKSLNSGRTLFMGPGGYAMTDATGRLVPEFFGDGMANLSEANTRTSFNDGTSVVFSTSNRVIVAASTYDNPGGRSTFSVVAYKFNDPGLKTVKAQLTGSRLDITGTSQSDTVVLQREGTNIAVTANGRKSTFSASQVRSIKFVGGSRNDALFASNMSIPVTFDGGSGNDLFFGSSVADNATGGDGNDSLFGNGGADVMNGNTGTDRAFRDTTDQLTSIESVL